MFTADDWTFGTLLMFYAAILSLVSWIFLVLWEADLPGRIRRYREYVRLRHEMKRRRQVIAYRRFVSPRGEKE